MSYSQNERFWENLTEKLKRTPQRYHFLPTVCFIVNYKLLPILTIILWQLIL